MKGSKRRHRIQFLAPDFKQMNLKNNLLAIMKSAIFEEWDEMIEFGLALRVKCIKHHTHAITPAESVFQSAPPSFILVSFCNVKHEGAPRLALFNPSNSTLIPLSLPRSLRRTNGITGLVADDKYIYAATQDSEVEGERGAFLLIFARNSFSFVSSFRFSHAVDVHSMCLYQNRLLAVSAGTDEVLDLKINDGTVESESIYWRAGEKRLDNYHLNGICSTPEGLLLCGFGNRNGGLWTSASNGFISNLDQQKILASGLEQPHSVCCFRSSIAFCESRKGTVRIWNKSIGQRLPGYTRGLCHAGSFLFAATSVGRRVSRTTGQVIDNPSAAGVCHGECTINQLDSDTLTLLKTFCFNTGADEIYDLLPIACISDWPVGFENFEPGR